MARAAVVVVNATETWRDDLTIVARLPGGEEIRTAVPIVGATVGTQGWLRVPRLRAAGRGDRCPLELKLQRKARGGDGEQWETLDTASVALRVRQPSPDAQAHVPQRDRWQRAVLRGRAGAPGRG